MMATVRSPFPQCRDFSAQRIDNGLAVRALGLYLVDPVLLKAGGARLDVGYQLRVGIDDLYVGLRHCLLAARIGGYKIPRRFAFVDALPKSALGKVLKADLRRRFGVKVASEPG